MNQDICAEGAWTQLLSTLKRPRGVRFEGSYSPGSVMATHKGVQLAYMGAGILC